MNVRKLLFKVYCRLHPFPNDRSKEYWQAAAKINPFGTICTNATEETFEDRFSVVQFLQLTHNMVVLDLGCGIGRTTPLVAPQVLYYFGVDFSENMIKKARKRHKGILNVSFLVNDGWTVNVLPDNFVDRAYCELVFQHISPKNTLSYIQDVHRVLKPHGVFLAMIPRLDFYKDEAFAITREQTLQFFSDYNQLELVDEEKWKAYYMVRATK